VKADPEVGDKVDGEVCRLFQMERRHDSNERHVSAAQLPEPDVIDFKMPIFEKCYIFWKNERKRMSDSTTM
jgi:hypothetical protein